MWNTLNAEKEGLGFAYRKLNDIIGDSYIRWQELWVEKKIPFRILYSDDYLRSEKYKTINPHIPEGIFISKYIPEETLTINFQMDIYNNVVSIYNWHEGELFGIEIYNDKVASFQRQIFEILWTRGEGR